MSCNYNNLNTDNHHKCENLPPLPKSGKKDNFASTRSRCNQLVKECNKHGPHLLNIRDYGLTSQDRSLLGGSDSDVLAWESGD